MRDAFAEGIRLFNSGSFFECHEALEALWLRADGEEKAFLHGLIQIAVAFHHYTRGNEAGFRSVFQKGWNKLTRFKEDRGGIDLRSLHRQLHAWRDYLARTAQKPASARMTSQGKTSEKASTAPVPAMPRIRFERRRA